MASVGAYSIFSLKGGIPYAGVKLRDITREGIAGKAFRVVGLHAYPQVVASTTLVNSAVTIKTTMSAYAALMGGLVTVVDDFGDSRSNILVHDVQQVEAFGILTPVPATGANKVLQCYWLLEDLSTSY